MTPEGIPRYVRGKALVHRVARWQTEPKEGVHFWTACDFAAFKPYDKEPMWGDTKIDQVVTCLWCVVERNGLQNRESHELP